MSAPVSVTERVNPLAEGIDGCDGAGIVSRLAMCDGELFGVPGYEGRDWSLGGSAAVRSLARLADAVYGTLSAGGDVVVAGAGTSGRLAFKACRSLNAVLEGKARDKRPRCHYLIAGGDAALFESQEGAEDSKEAAVRDLRKLLDEVKGSSTVHEEEASTVQGEPSTALGRRRSPTLVVGITCGLSATYVGALMDAALDAREEGMGACLVGFNPAELARDLKVPDWPGRTFRDVVQRMKDAEGESEQCLMVLPVVGPEAICGSTRMKGGTATKVVLEIGLGLGVTRFVGHAVAALGPRQAGSPWEEKDALHDKSAVSRAASAACVGRYAKAVSAVYQQAVAESLAQVIDAGGASLRAGGRVFYLGRGDAGIVGVVDASEQRPTYGAGVDDFRGFVVGGADAFYGKAKARGGRSRDALVERLEEKLGAEEWFMAKVLPSLSELDLVVVTSLDEHSGVPLPRGLVGALVAKRKVVGFKLASVLVPTPGAIDVREDGDANVLEAWSQEGWEPVASVRVDLVGGGMLADGIPGPAEVALKLSLNAVSTGAHVLKGKVHGCRMIDVKVSNIKLFHRSVSIVRETAAVGTGRAAFYLLAAVHGAFPEWQGPRTFDGFEDTVTQDVIGKAVGKAILMASVVPCAILLAKGLVATPDLGFAAIKREPVLRRHLEG